MRNFVILMSATALAACGSEASTVNSVSSTSTGSSTSTSTTTPDIYAEFTKPTTAKTYSGVGGSQVYSYTTDARNCCNQQAQTFAANTSTVRSSGAQISYDPSNATFTLVVNDPNTGAATQTRFQDPASRTNFGGSVEPQWGVPNLANPNFRYLQAGDGNPLSPYSQSGTGSIYKGTNAIPPDGTTGSTYQSTDFFYEVPGSSTQYVTLAGYLRNSLTWTDVADPSDSTKTIHQATWHLERGAFAYGAATSSSAVPVTGTGTYTGNMLATMVYNPTIDGAYGAKLPTYFQWIEGSATTAVNFATNGVTLALTGTVTNPWIDTFTSPTTTSVAGGTSFTAAGTATINMVNTGGFTGQFSSASFGSTTNGSPTAVSIAGSTINGTFYGPAAQEVGGGFHIVGGIPDQRVDILGAFTGKKP